MFWQNGLIHPEKKRRGGEQRKAIHAGPWLSTTTPTLTKFVWTRVSLFQAEFCNTQLQRVAMTE